MMVPVCAVLLHYILALVMDMQQRRDTRKLQRLQDAKKSMVKELKVKPSTLLVACQGAACQLFCWLAVLFYCGLYAVGSCQCSVICMLLAAASAVWFVCCWQLPVQCGLYAVGSCQGFRIPWATLLPA